jgi:hypothetical protein
MIVLNEVYKDLKVDIFIQLEDYKLQLSAKCSLSCPL